LGFVFWLGQNLDRAGFEAFPAKSVAAAIELLETLQLTVDLIVINYTLSGTASLISQSRRDRANLKVISLVEDADAPVPPDADEQYLKPSGIYNDFKQDWLRKIRNVLVETPLAIG